MNILLFGSTGMLGNYVYNILSQSYNVICITRDDFDIEKDSWILLDNKISNLLKKNDVIINCAGIIPQKNNNDYQKFIKVNSIFPHKLQEISISYKYKFIHITTDCVFNGSKGNYVETDKHDNESIYGITKSLGEPELSCIIRTSIIGEELFCKTNLLEWLIKQSGKSINGYTNYLWNGITCLTLANIIKKIIDDNIFWNGVKHIYSPETISKYTLCQYINDIYNLNISINKYELSCSKNMTLSGNNNFKIENIKEQIIEQYKFNLIKKGSFINLNYCRFCNNTNIHQIINFNDFPLAGGFLSKKINVLHEKVYPLTFLFCNNCKTGLIKEIINSDRLFKEINGNGYFYYSSSIKALVIHFNELALKIHSLYPYKKNILEIGCNDGVLLNSLYKDNYKLIGIDPSSTINNISNANIIKYNTFFNTELCNNIIEKHGKQDIIISCNCLAHINDIDEIYSNIKKILHNDGIIIIEVHYIKNIIDELNFDFIYHEHMSYYSVNTFLQICKKYNFYLQDLELIKTHGGSLRVFLTHQKNNQLYNDKIQHIIDNELNMKNSITNLFANIELWKNNIINIIKKTREQNISLIGYGASGRTNTIINYINIDFDYILDDSPNKIGNYIPYFHTPIIDSNDIYKLNINTIFILAWTYTQNIINKHKQFILNGGKFIKILPSIIEINKDNYIDYL